MSQTSYQLLHPAILDEEVGFEPTSALTISAVATDPLLDTTSFRLSKNSTARSIAQTRAAVLYDNHNKLFTRELPGRRALPVLVVDGLVERDELPRVRVEDALLALVVLVERMIGLLAERGVLVEPLRLVPLRVLHAAETGGDLGVIGAVDVEAVALSAMLD